MDMRLSKLRELVKDREAWRAAVHGLQRVERLNNSGFYFGDLKSANSLCKTLGARGGEWVFLVVSEAGEERLDRQASGDPPPRPLLHCEEQMSVLGALRACDCRWPLGPRSQPWLHGAPFRAGYRKVT